MRALAKLINLNSPDLALFVGEALVGNDVVDQLSKFNQVGAALSRVYIWRTSHVCWLRTVLYSHTDLKKVNVKSIVICGDTP
ncbi:hypothetical protein Vadar_029958 [Vaccinium darrowii]|uniref:Uncharacterized protein n=1 Tax=Vaccinium darrowii TaxID=229202 RepID=A0ACB7Z085_9ERIC|nr:hypothetical protein Vadar_029958 [Vaccinium darrowii]